MGRTQTPADFWQRVDRSGGADACWPWQGARCAGGYAQCSVNKRRVMVHRYAYELLVGPIPEGMELDHVRARGCTTRHCCNPGHLEPVDHRTNTLRGDTFATANLQKTHCPRGHALVEENCLPFQWRRGHRVCRICHQEVQRRYDRKTRAAERAARTKPTHCRNGHPRNEENTAIDRRGYPICRECHRARCQEYRARHSQLPTP